MAPRFSRIWLILASLACALPAGADDFSVLRLDAGPEIEGPVAACRLQDSASESVIVRSVSAEGVRRLTIWSLNGNESGFDDPVSLVLPAEVIFFDCGSLGSSGADSLVLFTADGALVLDGRSGRLRPLVRFASVYRVPLAEHIPTLDVLRDIDGDGLDDLLIPDFEVYRLYLQRADGGFAPEIRLHVPATMELNYREFPWYRFATPYLADMNRDGSKDLLFWQRGGLRVFARSGSDHYRTEGRLVALPMELEEEGMAGLSIQLGEAEDQSNLETRTLYKVADLNGDGDTDLVTLTIRSAGVFSKSSRYDIYMGRAERGGVRFAAEPDNVIESDGILFGIDEQDFDDDGLIDFVVSSAQIGLGRILAALITGSFSSDLDFYRLEEGRYSRQRSAHREISAHFDFSSGKVFYPTILIADVDGDRRSDLIVQDGRTGLEVFRGQQGKQLFASAPRKFSIAMPGNPDMITLADLNGDGKRDIILRYQREDGDLFGHLNVLLAQ